MNPKVDFYFTKNEKWQKEISLMREIALDCPLEEELKWGCPCYTLGKKNVVLIHVFKEYCAFLFYKGAIMKDPNGILIQQTENVQAGRQVRFTHLGEIVALQSVLRSYIYEAIEIEKAGLKVPMKKTKEFEMVEEFQEVLKKDETLQTAFYGLTPGRQRAYLLHFSTAKQSKTRVTRIEKYIPKILEGKGIDD